MKKNPIYWSSIICAILLVFAINLIVNFSISTFLYTLLCFATIIVPYALFVLIVKFLPEKWFDPNKKIFHVFKFESKLYEAFGIKKWKDKIPELGKSLAGFDKGKIANPKDPKYLLMFLNEICKGSFGHAFCIIWGYLALVVIAFVTPFPFVLTAGLPIAVISGFVHSLSLMILRYMRPRMLKLYELSCKQAERQAKAEKDTNQDKQTTEIETATNKNQNSITVADEQNKQ